jgi:hypothetical protein
MEMCPTRSVRSQKHAASGRWSEHARVHAIFASSYLALDNQLAAVAELRAHIELVTNQLVQPRRLLPAPAHTPPGREAELRKFRSRHGWRGALDLTSSRDFYDTILVLLAPDGPPALWSQDRVFCRIQWVAVATGTYRILLTSFESVNTGDSTVSG